MSKLPPEPPGREVTPEALYRRRREFLKSTALFTGTAAALGTGLHLLSRSPSAAAPAAPAPGSTVRAAPLEEALTPFEDVTTYNNFYEFGLDKSDPAREAHTLRPHPWAVRIEGEVREPRTVDVDTLKSWFPLEERIYRMRCVEAWSMVIPWLGIPLGALLRRLEPTSRARYVAFTSLEDPEQMPDQRGGALEWPYVEGLRLDEAMHPLSLLAVGLYGKALPNQNGAPLRLVVPWKYGFKGIKSIVRMTLTQSEPPTTWNRAAPGEYGFYANVNPAVDHPRWSQATERRIGEFRRRPTLPFNGYAEAVAGLYQGMDLRRQF